MSYAKFGFSEFTTWPWTFEKDLAMYKKNGAQYIEVCEFKFAHEEYDKLALVEPTGLTVGSVQARVHSVFPDTMAPEPKDADDRIAAIEKAIEASAPYLPQRTPFIVITGAEPEKNMRAGIDKTRDALKRLGEFAGQRGMTIAFEPLNPITVHTDTMLWGLDRGLELVESVKQPNVGLCIDTWNIWETPNVLEVIADCAERILVVQLSDWKTPRSTADRYSLGDGELRLADLIRAIRKTGYDGPWVVEILSSLHLEGSLWKSDMEQLLRNNRDAFERLWKASE